MSESQKKNPDLIFTEQELIAIRQIAAVLFFQTEEDHGIDNKDGFSVSLSQAFVAYMGLRSISTCEVGETFRVRAAVEGRHSVVRKNEDGTYELLEY